MQASARRALEAANAKPRDVRAVGITNQRETLVLWDRRTLQPVAPAIVWQDRRTADQCARLREAGHEARVREITGLVLDPYFTATKLAWALEHVDGAKEAAAGTVDSWLVAKLSEGRDHVTDASNASRTLLFDIERGVWSEEMAELFRVSLANLPRVADSSGPISRSLGEIAAPITGIAGDQQAALFGQACTADGMAKNTYGTGSFVLMQTGRRRVASSSGMLTTVAWRRDGALSYALEGAIFVTGAALQWLRDGLGVIARAADVTLKEGRSLIMLVRETPLHVGHLKMMLALAEMGAVVLPPMPAFYNRPKELDDIVNHTVARVLDRLNLPQTLVAEWKGTHPRVPTGPLGG